MLTFLDRRTVLAGMAAMSTLTFARPSIAQTTHDVQMLNKHPEDKRKLMVYYPRILVVEPGDTVRFLSVDKGHNAQSVKGMIPDGTEPWKGKISQEISVTFEKPGIYGYECLPHKAVGMVGLIIVKGEGMNDNLEAAKAVRQRGRAKKAWEEIWAEVDEQALLS